MKADACEDERRKNEHVQDVEPGERGAADVVAGEDRVSDERTDDGRARRLFRADDRRPDAVSVPAQELSGKPHRQREQQQDHAAHPIHLARVFVRGVKVDLRHVHDGDQDHRRCAEEVHAAKHAAERGLLGDVTQAFERFATGGDVGKGEADAGDNLHHEAAEGRAAEDVPPSRVARDDVIHQRGDGL